MSPRIIRRLHIPRRTAHAHIQLIIHRAGPGLQLPMHSSGRQVEGARVEEQETAFARGDGGEFWEADVVADRQGDLAVFRQGDEGDFVAGGKDVGLAESDFVGDGDVEEVEFAVGGEEGAGGGEEEGGVVVFWRGRGRV